MHQSPTWRTLSWFLDNDEWVAISSVSKIMKDNIRDLESAKQQTKFIEERNTLLKKRLIVGNQAWEEYSPHVWAWLPGPEKSEFA